MFAIIDYGMGNLKSLSDKFQRLGIEAIITSDIEKIEKADKLILPGVGYFSAGMNNLTKLGIIPVLSNKVIEQRTPILGICLGMQLFSRFSEEGNVSGLGWIAADTKRFRFENGSKVLRIPHIGWNTLIIKNGHSLARDVLPEAEYYFIHSYHVCCDDQSDIAAFTNYGFDFISMIQKGNIYGTQFHPEKSHSAGMKILRNFLEV